MKKEWLLLIGSVSLTLITALLLVRWFAPQLLGLPVDLQMVRVSQKVPPFFDNIFRAEDYESQNYLIQDPYIMRAKPLLPVLLRVGPSDILGFRNRSVPNIADIITIGDSQTYGNNVLIEENWPSIMINNLEKYSPTLYNMSVGGWGAAEYFEIFNKALYLQPKVVIVAFYAGNDAIDTFKKVYTDERWKSLRLDPRLKSSDIPAMPENAEWNVTFSDGSEIIFTPAYRHLANRRDSPAVNAGYEIMGKIARKMAGIAKSAQISLVFTIIPTKELAFKKKIMLDNIRPRSDYLALVDDEEKNIETFAEELRSITGSVYVDLLEPLQRAVIESENLYPESDQDGHLIENGYRLIGETLREAAAKSLPDRLHGGVIAQISINDNNYWPLFVKDNYFFRFSNQEIAEKNGWSQQNIKIADLREISRLKYGGLISTVDPSRFGPEASN